MEYRDFKIGLEFYCGDHHWKCTDIGTRVIVAIQIDLDTSYLNGPPYAIREIVFDEYDIEGCSL
jgi:hypothetical protein